MSELLEKKLSSNSTHDNSSNLIERALKPRYRFSSQQNTSRQVVLSVCQTETRLPSTDKSQNKWVVLRRPTRRFSHRKNRKAFRLRSGSECQRWMALS